MQELAGYPNTLEAAKAGALESREALRKAMKRLSKDTYADIAEFRAEGVNWFKKRSDKKDFKAGMKHMRLAFALIFDAYKDVALAFGYLGKGPYYQTAANTMFRAGTGTMLSNDRFADGLKRLRKLQ